jgi:predicted kinase
MIDDTSNRLAIPHPVLLAMFGTPGSGKTHFAARLCQEERLFHLNSDRIRSEIAPVSTRSPEETATVFRVMDHVADEVLARGGGVVYDALFSRRVYRDRVREMARCRGAEYLLIWMRTPIETAIERVANRASQDAQTAAYFPPSTREKIQFISASIQEPEDEPFIEIDGTADYESQINQLIEYWRTQARNF